MTARDNKKPENLTVKRNALYSRLKKSNEMQEYPDIYLLLNYCTCFGRPSRPSSEVHQTVVAASGADHTVWGASFLKRDQTRTDLGPYPLVQITLSGKQASSNGPNSPYLVTFEEACSPDSTICIRGCN